MKIQAYDFYLFFYTYIMHSNPKTQSNLYNIQRPNSIIYFLSQMKHSINRSALIQKFQSSLRATFTASDNHQIQTATQFIETFASDPDFEFIAQQILVDLSSNQPDSDLQKAVLLVLEQQTIQRYSISNVSQQSYMDSQRILSILFSIISHASIRFNIKKNVVKTIKITMSFQKNQLKNSLIQKIIQNFTQIDPFLQQKDKLNQKMFRYFETILLYSDIILANPVYTSLSFQFFKNALEKFTVLLSLILKEIHSKLEQFSSQLAFGQIMEMMELNTNILCKMILDCDFIDQNTVMTWFYDGKSTTLVRELIEFTETVNKAKIDIFACTICFRNAITNLYQKILDFLVIYKEKSPEDFYNAQIFKLYKTNIIPQQIQICVRTVQKQLQQRSFVSSLYSHLKLINKALHFHGFYNLFIEAITFLTDSVLIPIITFQQINGEELNAQDYLNFVEFINSKQQKRLLTPSTLQEISRHIKIKNPAILPEQVLEHQDQNSVGNQIKAQLKLRLHDQISESYSWFQCKQVSVQIFRNLLKKIDTFRPFIISTLSQQMKYPKLNGPQKELIFLFLAIAKELVAQNNELKSLTIGFIESEFINLRANLFAKKNIFNCQTHTFRSVLLFLCTFRAYLSEIYIYYEVQNSNTFKSHIHFLNQLLTKTQISIFNLKEIDQQNDNIYENTTIAITIMYVLKDLATQSFGDEFARTILRTFSNILQSINFQSDEIKNDKNEHQLTFMHAFFGLLDEIIEYFSYELQGTSALQNLTDLCVQNIFEICKIERESPTLKVMESLLWRTLLNLLSHKTLIVDMINSLQYLLRQIVKLYKNEEFFRENFRLKDSSTQEYILIVATYIFVYIRSIIKNDKTIGSLHLELLQIIFEKNEIQEAFNPFGYEFQFIQRLFFYSASPKRQGIEEKVQINEQGQDYPTKQQIKLESINYSSLEISYQYAIRTIKQIQQPISLLKKCEATIILQSLAFYDAEFFKFSKIEEILSLLFDHLGHSELYEAEDYSPYIQNSFSLILTLISMLPEQRLLFAFEEVKKFHNRCNKIPKKFEYCSKLNILVLGKFYETFVGKLILWKLSKCNQYLRKDPDFSTENLFKKLEHQMENLDVQEIALQLCKMHNLMQGIFDMLMQCLDVHFSVLKENKFDFNSTSSDVVMNFKNVQGNLLNRFTSLDEIAELKRNLTAQNIFGSKSQLDSRFFEALQYSVVEMDHGQIDDLFNMLTNLAINQYNRLIQVCIQQTHKINQETVKSIIRMQKVNRTNRKIYKVK